MLARMIHATGADDSQPTGQMTGQPCLAPGALSASARQRLGPGREGDLVTGTFASSNRRPLPLTSLVWPADARAYGVAGAR